MKTMKTMINAAMQTNELKKTKKIKLEIEIEKEEIIFKIKDVKCFKKLIVSKKEFVELICNACQRVVKSIEIEETKITWLEFATKYTMEKIEFENIICIRATLNYATVVRADKGEYVTTKGLNELIKLLPTEQFMQIHRSTIVNKLHITRINKGRSNQLTMSNGTKLTVGATFLHAFRKWIIGK